jgi:hypothetical protein
MDVGKCWILVCLFIMHNQHHWQFIQETTIKADQKTNHVWTSHCWYSAITSVRSPSFYMTAFSASVTNLTAHLPQSHDRSCYVSWRILAPPPLWLQKHTDLRAYDLAHSPHLWHQPTLPNVFHAWSWRLPGINPVVTMLYELLLNMQKASPPSPSCTWAGMETSWN